MFRPLRRTRQELPQDVCQRLLAENTYGVLAVLGDEDYPYAVPLNYVCRDNCLYMHCAKEGHKIDALRKSPRASFCVVDAHEIDTKLLTTHYRSVIAFGTVRIVEDREEVRAAVSHLSLTLAPSNHAGLEEELRTLLDKTTILEFRIEHCTGKEENTLAAARRKAAQETQAQE